MFEAVDGLVNEHAEIEQRLADPGIHSDQGLAKRLNRRYAEQLRWTLVMIGLTEDASQYEARGYTATRSAIGYTTFRHFGMPEGNNNGEGDHAPRHHFAQAQGSGFFISGDGYIVTNNHVVDHASEVTVTTSEGKSMSAKVIGVDSKTDLALLKAEGRDFPYVTFAAHTPRVGDWVIAVGNPMGFIGALTTGVPVR